MPIDLRSCSVFEDPERVTHRRSVISCLMVGLALGYVLACYFGEMCWEGHVSGTQQVWTFLGQSTQEVSSG